MYDPEILKTLPIDILKDMKRSRQENLAISIERQETVLVEINSHSECIEQLDKFIGEVAKRQTQQT